MKKSFRSLVAILFGREKHRVRPTQLEIQQLTEAPSAPKQFLRHVARRAVDLARSTDQEQDNLAAAAKQLARSGDLEEAKRVAETIKDREKKDSARCELVRAYALAGEIPRAAELMRRLPSLSAVVGAVCEDLAKLGRIDHAISLANSLDEDFDRDWVAENLATIASASGRSTEYVACIDQIQNARAKNAGLAVLAKALATEGKVHESLSAAARITERQSWVLDGIADILKKAGKLRAFVEVARRLRESPIREATLSLAVELLARDGQYSEAVEFANLLGTAPEDILPCRLGDFPKESLCEETLVLFERIQNEKIREQFLWTLAVGFMKADQTARLVDATKRLLGPKSRDFVFNALATVSLNGAKVEDAEEFSRQIVAEELRTQVEDRLVKLRTEAETHATETPAEAVERLKREVSANEDFNFKAGERIGKVVLRSLATGATGLAGSALGVVNLITDESMSGGELQRQRLGAVLASNNQIRFLLDSLCIIGKEDHRDELLAGAAEELAGRGELNLACECAAKVRGRLAEYPRFNVWERILSKAGLGKTPREILAAIDRVHCKGHRDKLRGAAAAVFMDDGDLAKGKEFLAQVEDPEARTRAVAEARIALRGCEPSVAQVLELAGLMQEGTDKELFHHSAAGVMQGAGRTEDAFRVARAVEDPFGRTLGMFFAGSNAIRDHVRSGRIDLALKTACGAKDKCIQANLQDTLLEEMLQTGNMDRIMEVLSLGLAIAKRFKMAEVRASILVSLAAALACQRTELGILQLKPSFNVPEKDLAVGILKALED